MKTRKDLALFRVSKRPSSVHAKTCFPSGNTYIYEINQFILRENFRVTKVKRNLYNIQDTYTGSFRFLRGDKVRCLLKNFRYLIVAHKYIFFFIIINNLFSYFYGKLCTSVTYHKYWRAKGVVRFRTASLAAGTRFMNGASLPRRTGDCTRPCKQPAA